MAEYKELINRLRQEAEFEAYLQPHSANETPKLLFEAADVIEKLNGERKKGKWLQLGKCSECGGSAPFWSMASTYYKSDFCPHCGADMRGET